MGGCGPLKWRHTCHTNVTERCGGTPPPLPPSASLGDKPLQRLIGLLIHVYLGITGGWVVCFENVNPKCGGTLTSWGGVTHLGIFSLAASFSTVVLCSSRRPPMNFSPRMNERIIYFSSFILASVKFEICFASRILCIFRPPISWLPGCLGDCLLCVSLVAAVPFCLSICPCLYVGLSVCLTH